MTFKETLKLNTGASIPAVGFGTWQAAPKEVEHAVEIALRKGYRHLDCAAVYHNENEVGAGIRKSGVKREDIFITTKLWNHKHDPKDVEAALDSSLRDLGIEYADLYLMHWPCAFAPGNDFLPTDSDGVIKLSDIPFTETWKALEKLLKTGKTKAIGVSNFNERQVKELLAIATVIPTVNQIEAHPYLQQKSLLDFCHSRDILIQAYSPLGNNLTGEARTIDDPVVHEVGKRLNMNPGQVLVSWAVQRGTAVLPKSVAENRIISNRQIRELPQDEFDTLNRLERHKRYNVPSYEWGYDVFDELSDEIVKKSAKEIGAKNKVANKL